MSASIYSTLTGVLTGKHPELGILCRETGEVLVPASGTRKAHWTFGSKGNRYLRVRFHGKDYPVHRLIAQTFLDNPLNLPTVDHIDRNPSNNRVDSLRYASYETQENNRQICYDSLEKYGVRKCKDPRAYRRALYANNPEFAERQRAYQREQYAANPERVLARNRAYQAKQRALGKKQRKCPDGKYHMLTDEEFNKRYGE